MAKKYKGAAKQIEERVERVFQAVSSGIQIPIMKIHDIFAAGREAAHAGGDDAAVEAAVRAAINAVWVS